MFILPAVKLCVGGLRQIAVLLAIFLILVPWVIEIK
jgi:hypothetical protein